MSRTIVLDPAAQSDLDAIYDYLFTRNPAAADRYIRELTERCQVYAQSPFIGQEEREIARYLGAAEEHVRSFLYGNHRCYYVVSDEELRVLRFLDMRRDPDAPLEELFAS
jgi:plasmid stabilization system protein ParE